MTVRREVRARDGGAVAVMAFFFIIVMGAFVGLIINVGFMMDSRAELQNASDSAALAAAGSLDGTNAGLTEARTQAELYSSAHTVGADVVKISQADDVIFGKWHFKSTECKFGGGSDCFEPLPGPPDPLDVTAVRVLNGRDGGNHNDPLKTWFAFFLEQRKTEVDSSAIAVGHGTGVVDCALPFVIDAACIDQPICDGGKTQTYVGVASNDKNDNMGFVNLSGGVASNSKIREQIEKGCDGYSVIDEGKFQNGADLNKQIRDALLKRVCTEGAEQAIAVTDIAGGTCLKAKYNQSGPIVTFIKVRILQVTNEQGKAQVCSSGGVSLQGGTGMKRSLKFEILCDAPAGSGGGRPLGPANRLRLVR